MAKPLAVDNSKLKEQARQRRLEEARIQQVTEKPTKALFGPPIPVSRPNDPTFNKLSDWFGPYETGAYRPFFSPNNDTTTTHEESVDRRQTDNSRHGDNAARHNNDALRHGDNMRHGDNRHADARHGDAMRHGDGRQRDNLRHGDNRNIDNRNSDNRNNSRPNDNTLRNSKGTSGHGATALVSGGDGAVDPSRQGVFEQFVKSNSNAASARDNAQVPSLDGRHSNAMVRHGNGKAPDPTTSSGVKQSLQHSDKMKNRPPTTVDRPRPDRVEEPVVNPTNVGSRPDGSRPGLPPSKSFSTPLQNSPPFVNHASPSIANSGSRGDAKNSAWGHHGADPSKDHEKTSRIGNPVSRVNGVRVVHHAGAAGKDVDMERKLTLNIPPLSGGHEKFDEKSFFKRLSEDLDIPLPLTAIMTPKKTDSSTFPFPAVLPDVSLHDHDDIIPQKACLSDDEDDDPDDDELPDDGLLLPPPQHHPLLSKQLPHHPHPPHPHHPLTVPHADAPTNVLSDLEVSSSDSEDEQDKETGLDERMSSPPSRRLPPPPPDDMVTSPAGPTDNHHHTILDRVPDSGVRSRHASESSTSSSEGSGTSGSESGSSLSDDEGNERTTERLGQEKDEEEDENEDKQPKRPSWDLSNFIPKSNGLPGLLSSSSSSPLAVNRQMSRDSDFDTDSDPLKLIGDRVLSAARLSPLPMTASSAIDHLDDSDFHADITAFLSPSKDQLAPSSWGLPQIDITPPPPPVVAPARFKPAVTPPTSVTPRSTPLLLGVDYSDGEPSVVVRICRSRLSTDVVAKTDAGSTCDVGGTDSASDNVACRSVGARTTNGKSVVARAATPSERVNCSVDLVAVDAKLLARTPAKRSADVSPGRTAGLTQQQQQVVRSPSLAPPGDARSSSAAVVDSDSRTEKLSPRKMGSDRKEETQCVASGKGAKRKAEDGGLGRSDQKKVCDRSGVLLSSASSVGKEDRKSQNLTQNGEPDRAKGSRGPPEPTNHVKSPALISATEDSNSRSSSSQKRIEKTKSQNGYSKIEEKPKKAVAATTPCLDGSRNNVVVTEPPFVSVEKPAKPGATPMVNGGVGESPAYPGTFDASEPCDGVTTSRKRSAPCEEDDQPLDRRKDPANGIRKPESLESSEFYLQQARRLKHVGDSGPDKFSKALSYIESVVAFISHCSALEQEHAEPARIQKMYQDTMALCQYIIRVIENVTNVEKHQLLVIGLRIQSVICLKLYYTRKLEIAKLKTVLDEHNKSYSSKPLQIPSPYQANHHHSANATSTVPGNWNHANGTPSPHSPRPSPSPAGSIGSVGSAGSSNGDSAGGVGMGKPLSSSSATSLLNGHMTSIVVPQRIHSVMMNYLSHTNHLYQCHESWDQADSILTTHPSVAEFFHSLDVECGPIDLHSSTPALIRYASEVVNRVRNNARRLSQATRAD